MSLSLALHVPAFSELSPLEARVAVVKSNHASGMIDRHRLIAILRRSCTELHIDESSVPRIVFIRISEKDASVGGVPAGAPVMVERAYLTVDGNNGPEARFLVWFTGKPSDQELVAAVVHVFRINFGLNLSDADLIRASQRVLRQLKATVDARSFMK